MPDPLQSFVLTCGGRTAPLAIIVAANVAVTEGEATLSDLTEESSTIADLLHKAGYDVHVLRTGRYGELSALLQDDDIRSRLVVFHYCGHANRELVNLMDDRGQPAGVTAWALSQQMTSETRALRLVYINGCLSEPQENEYREAFPRVNFIGTKRNIPDWFAKGFAIEFYRRLLGSEEPFGQVSVAQVLRNVSGQDGGKKPDRIRNILHVRYAPEHVTDIPEAERPDLAFCLADGIGLMGSYVLEDRQLRRSGVLLIYAAVLLAVQAGFLFCAHVWTQTSSPAFQASFAYHPTCEMLQGVRGWLLTNARSDATLTPLLRGCYPVGISPFLDRSPWPGFFIEWFRSVMLLACLMPIALVIYRRMPRDHPQFFSREAGRWLRMRAHRPYIVVAVLALVLVSAYHVTLAPATLSVVSPEDLSGLANWMQMRWPANHADPNIWRGFETRLATVHDLRESLATTPLTGAAYRQMYLYPYLWYLGYSLTLYLMLALPILAVILHGVRFDSGEIRMRLAEVQVALRMTRDGYFHRTDRVLDLLHDVRRCMKRQIRRFVATFAILTGFVAYEILVGKVTTALFAHIISLLVFALVFFGVLQVYGLWNVYRDALARMETMLRRVQDEDLMTRLRPAKRALEEAYFPAPALTWTIFALSFVVLIYLTWVSILPFVRVDWTVFTHHLPILGW